MIVYLGCGLDTRITRIDPPSSISWFDVDYPEVINLRKTFYEEHAGYKMLSTSVTDSKWLEAIPVSRRTLIIAEGVLEYLTEEEVKTLFNRLTAYFGHGQIFFDVMNSFAIQSGKEKLKEVTEAIHKWAVDDVSEVDKLNPRLKKIEVIPLFKSAFMRQIPWGFVPF